MSKTRNVFVVVTIIGLMAIGFLGGAPLPAVHAATGTNFDNIVIIAMENQNYADVMGTGTGSPNAPFIGSLLAKSSTVPNYHGYGAAGRSISGCSAACYVALISGDTYGVLDGYGCCISSPTFIDRIVATGGTWQAYCESGCPRGNDHFPFTAFSSISSSPNIFTSGSVSTADFINAANSAGPPTFLWFTPTDSHNMHDNSIQTGDSYLQSFLVGTGTVAAPASGSLLASNLFQAGRRTLLLLWWDEYDPAPILFYGTGVKQAYISGSNLYDEYSVLRLLENNWALPTLASNDAAAAPMTEILGATAPSPLSASFTSNPSQPVNGSTVTFTATVSGGTAPYSYAWSFGDSLTATTNPASHTYALPGTYQATLRVTDTIAAVVSVNHSVTVTSAPPPAQTVNVFAYGSNMETNQMSSRTGGTAVFLDTARVNGYSFVIDHTNVAGTGTSDIIPNTSDFIEGVVWKIPKSVLPQLDSFEGVPTSYQRNDNFPVVSLISGQTITTSVYTVVNKETSPPPPSQAYITLIQQGIIEHNLGQAYLDKINAILGVTQPPPPPPPPPSGNFGSCTPLPQGWSCGNSNGLAGSSAGIVSGVLQTRESNPGVGSDNSYYFATTQKGTFPWSPCQAPASGVIPSGLTSVSTTFTPLTITPLGPYRYHIYVALYYWLPNGAVSAGGSSYQCLDTQVRVENIGGTFSPVGSTATYNPGDSFGWDQITIGSVSVGGTYTLTANVQQQCQQDEAAWGIPTSTPCELAGIEIGTEGYQFQQLDVDWPTVSLGTTNPSLTAIINLTPASPAAGQSVSFSGSATSGTPPYAYSWTFGDGGTASGSTVSHAYSTAGTYTVQLTVTDNTGTSASTSQTVTVTLTSPSPLQTRFAANPTSLRLGQTGTFTGTATGGTQPYSYSWDFGDGTIGSGAIATHGYSTPGSFTVTLTVTDSASQTGSASNTVNVSPSTTPDFTINASPTALSVQAGNSATSQVQLVSLNNFSGTVLLTAVVSPSGPSPRFTRASLTLSSGGSATSTFTVTTSPSIPIGTYDVSVDAVSGSTTHKVHVTLSVTAIPPPPDYAMSVSRSTLTIQAGWTQDSVMRLTSKNGFSGTVLVTATGSPGLNFTLTQGIVTLSPGSSQTLTLTVGVLPTTQAGTYSITLYAASGSLQHSTSLTVKATYNTPPGVRVPGPKSAVAGSSVQFVVNVTDPDLGETITLSATGLPPGASFDPTTGAFNWTPLPSQAGTYNVTFTATDNGNPPTSSSSSVLITVHGTAPPPPSTQSQGNCLLCQITQTAKSSTWLLITGVLAGFTLTLTVVYLRARSRLQEHRRMKRLTH